MGTRIEHHSIEADRSPSGLALRHLVTGDIGSSHLYVGEQWLKHGETVLLHTHPVEEVLIFTEGQGEVQLNDERFPVASGVTVHIPAGELHGFRNTTENELRVFVVFPQSGFAETHISDKQRT